MLDLPHDFSRRKQKIVNDLKIKRASKMPASRNTRCDELVNQVGNRVSCRDLLRKLCCNVHRRQPLQHRPGYGCRGQLSWSVLVKLFACPVPSAEGFLLAQSFDQKQVT